MASTPTYDGPPLQNERYKLCTILCQKRNGWTIKSFCQANFAGICTSQKSQRGYGYAVNRCVSPNAEWVEKVSPGQMSCVDSTVKTAGSATIPEADDETRGFCMKQCDDSLSRERQWFQKEIYTMCTQHLK
mmetsp:Transcript_53728/g.114681  ORF Transcript_53728/g.114681 Transcript_53728/m.114681 type:complete len:131 (+) Transcript_53728:218-610(+)|eukprot:CAMPEP_0206449492 /NCGR_PEP_ID=MMETSP0324_2-20121206/18117_1 /ASSEMBLY_ACC=CAM_ASM_000836 /TAXON_ID=2866 /ORGANISM="Crypthecodinium cohnii, Strain Seligo" /LENGTH=130 /DNA_ID=CAMNT_0053918871 /DNA_START=209 /DNA_END=601 /DNA_ORIENTATION=-